jgi:crossover junction endodeoxyribonuclease RuvC
MRYVGIDPSTKTGLVVLNESGEVLHKEEITSKMEGDPKRFMDLTAKIMLRLKYDDVICIEGFSYGSKGRGVSTQYGIGWLIRAELIRNGYSYREVAPSGLKKYATGKGVGKKEDMVLPLYKRWGFEHKSDNVRDAYVLAQIARGLEGAAELTAFQKEVLKKVI